MPPKTIYFVLLFVIAIVECGYIPPGPSYPCPTKPNEIQLLHPCTCDKGSDIGLYVTCKNAGIAVLSVGLGNLASFDSPIEELVLKECNIRRLYGTLFSRLRVRILKIENTPLTQIDDGVFLGVNRTLQNLYITDSNLETFPKQAFKDMGNLTILHIDGHEIKTLDKNIFAGSSAAGKLERVHLTNGKLSDLQIESFLPLRKLKTLDLHGNKLTTLKKNQFKGLRDVEVLDISYNNITKLESAHISDLTKLTWCNVSHNHLSEMSRGMFARNTVLKVLHMDHNKLKKLDTNSFRGMRFLRRLSMSDNEITEVGRGTFEAITRIGTIDLARNKIKKIDYQMFINLKYIEAIDLAENQITEIQKSAFTDIYLTNINISHNSISKIDAGAFVNCANITILDLSHNNLSTITPRAFDSTTYATELRLSFNNLTALNQIPLHNMTGLKVLNASHNMISSVPRNTFPKLYELHTVDISNNQLKDIFNSVFQSLFSLRFLYLNHNKLEQIKTTTFGTLPTLLHLDISNNLLTDISRGALSNLASCRTMDVSNNALEKIFMLPISLGEINFSYNNISSIPANLWPTMNSLLKLDLAYNPIGDNLYSDSFSGLLSLQTLVLTGVSLTRPPWEALSSLSSLQYLKLNHNNITTLNKAAFGRLPIVFDLDLSHNQITSVSQRTFDGLLQLLKLSLRHNLLSYIPNEAFRGLVSLRTLDLSNNFLEKLDNKTNGLLDDCLSLENVNLSHNKISFLTRKTFPNDPYIPYKIKTIDLSYNAMPVITKELITGTKHLEVLNISHNMLNDIRKSVIGNLTSLKILDLSFNLLNDLTSDKEIFRLPKNITAIDLSHNNILKLPMEHIKNATMLKIIDISNNSLEYFDEDLVTKIRNENIQVHFAGNPLQCDCFARPLKHYLMHLSRSQMMNDRLYSIITCAGPPLLAEEFFVNIDDNRLNCIENVAIKKKLEEENSHHSYSVESDIVFRNVLFSQKSIYLQWYIQTTKDVADFRLIIRNQRNDIRFGEYLPYYQRNYMLNVSDHAELKKAWWAKEQLEVCVLGGNSASMTFNFFQSQCKSLPENATLLPEDINLRARVAKTIYKSASTRSSGNVFKCNILMLLSYFIIHSSAI